MQHSRYPLKGFVGGHEAAGNLVVIDYGTPEQQEIRVAAESYWQKPGSLVFARKQGGGGWGDPLQRDPQAVLRDVLDDYVSVARARADYGLEVFGPDADRKYEIALRKIGIDLAMLSNEAGHA